MSDLPEQVWVVHHHDSMGETLTHSHGAGLVDHEHDGATLCDRSECIGAEEHGSHGS